MPPRRTSCCRADFARRRAWSAASELPLRRASSRIPRGWRARPRPPPPTAGSPDGRAERVAGRVRVARQVVSHALRSAPKALRLRGTTGLPRDSSRRSRGAARTPRAPRGRGCPVRRARRALSSGARSWLHLRNPRAERVAQLLHGSPQPGLHRSQRLLELSGDLAVRQSAEVGELDDAPLRLGGPTARVAHKRWRVFALRGAPPPAPRGLPRAHLR